MRATIKTIQKHWTDLDPDVRKQNQSSLAYINELAARVGISIRRWNIGSLFTVDGGPNLMSDFKAINKAFFAKMKEGEEGDVDTEVDPKIKESLQAFAKGLFDEEIWRQKRTIESKEYDLRHYERRQKSLMEELAKAHAKLHALEAGEGADSRIAKVEEDLEEILLNGWWGDLLVDGDWFWLRTTDDIVLSQRNKKAGLDQSFNLGQVSVGINLSRGECKVVPYKNNLRYDDLFHPHVNTTGSICWGDAAEASSKALVEWRVKDLLNLLQALLITYSPSNPYTQLNNFQFGTPFGRRNSDLRNPHNDRDKREAEERKRQKRLEEEAALAKERGDALDNAPQSQDEAVQDILAKL